MTQNCGKCHTCGAELRKESNPYLLTQFCPRCKTHRNYPSHGPKPKGDCADMCAKCGAPVEKTVHGKSYCDYMEARYIAYQGRPGAYRIRCDGQMVERASGEVLKHVAVDVKPRRTARARMPRAAVEVEK